MKKKLISLLLLCTMTTALVAGCGSSGSSDSSSQSSDSSSQSSDSSSQGSDSSSEEVTTQAEEQGEARDIFIYAVTDDPGNTLNYFTADDRVSMTICKTINEPLFSVNADGSYNYYAAESFDASEDGLTYTAKLKSGAVWSDGEALTADDVVYTFETYMAQDESGMLKVNGENIAVNKVDDATVEFVLPSVVASMPENISNVMLLPKHVFEGKDSLDMDMNEGGLVGCGPYIFSEMKSGEYISFEKNPNYVNGEANISKVVLQIITNDETAKAALQNGEVDAWIAMPSSLDGLDGFTVTPYSEGRVAYVRLNRVADSMQNADFRKGIFYALNRAEIMIAAYSSLDYATLSYSFLPAANGYYSEDIEKYEQDIDKAKELVANGSTDTLKLCYIGTDAAQTAQAQVIQAELKEVGINVELEGLEQAAYMNSAYDNEDKTYDMYLGGYIMTIDPDGFSGMFGTGQMINYASETVDSLFEQGKAEPDPDKRVEIYNELQKVVADEALFYPFGSNLRILVTNPNLQGIDEAGLAPIFTFEDMSKLSYK